MQIIRALGTQIMAKSMDVDTQKSTNKLLRVIVALMLRGRSEESPTLKQQIQILSDLGLRPSEIAQVLGRTSTHINKELSGLRKGRKRSI
jgi:DNA-directed RNA polymerase specialized sigma24 family protein